MDAVGLIASLALGLSFVVAGASKLAAGPAWPEQAAGLGAPTWTVPIVPWFELIVGALLIAQVGRRPAAVVAGRAPRGLHRAHRVDAPPGTASTVRVLRCLVGEADRPGPRCTQHAALVPRDPRCALSRAVVRSWSGRGEEERERAGFVAPGVVAAGRAAVTCTESRFACTIGASPVATSRSRATHFAGSWTLTRGSLRPVDT